MGGAAHKGKDGLRSCGTTVMQPPNRAGNTKGGFPRGRGEREYSIANLEGGRRKDSGRRRKRQNAGGEMDFDGKAKG